MPSTPLDYFEDCVAIAESLHLSDEIRRRISTAEHGKFTSVGLGHIAVIGGDVHLGVKRRSYGRVAERVAHEIMVAGTILSKKPDLYDNIPLFSLVAKDTEGDQFGVLTEDFTEGGTLSMHEERHRIDIFRPNTPTPLHQAVYDAVDGRVYPEAFGHMSAVITGSNTRQVLIDYDDILTSRFSKSPEYEEILSRIDEVTIQL